MLTLAHAGTPRALCDLRGSPLPFHPLQPGARVWLVVHRRPATVLARQPVNLSGSRFQYRIRLGPELAAVVPDTDLIPLPSLHPDIRPLGGKFPVCGIVDGGRHG